MIKSTGLFLASCLIAAAILPVSTDERPTTMPLKPLLKQLQYQHDYQISQWVEQSIVALGMARLSLNGCRAIVEGKVNKEKMCKKTAASFNGLCDRTDVVIVECEKALARLMKGDVNIDVQYLDINITGCAAVSVALECIAKEWK